MSRIKTSKPKLISLPTDPVPPVKAMTPDPPAAETKGATVPENRPSHLPAKYPPDPDPPQFYLGLIDDSPLLEENFAHAATEADRMRGKYVLCESMRGRFGALRGSHLLGPATREQIEASGCKAGEWAPLPRGKAA